MNKGFLTLLLGGLLGCASLGPRGPNHFFVEPMWVRQTLASEHLGSRRQHRFEPIVTEDLVISANAIDSLVAYDRETANERWRLRIGNGVEAGAILVDGKLLFGASDGEFYAVDAKSGRVEWKYGLHSEGLGKPYAHQGIVYVVSGNNVLQALEIATGKLVWAYTRRDPSNLSIRGGSQPNVIGDLVIAGFSDGSLVALKVATGAVAWEATLNHNKKFRDVDAHPIIDGDRLYVTSYDGALFCLTWKDGRILWSVEEGGETAVVIDENRIYYSSSGGKTMALDKNSGKVIWSKVNSSGIATRPGIYRNLLVVGEMNGPLRFLDRESGQEVGLFHPGWGVSSNPWIDDKRGQLYFMSAAANLYALRLEWRKLARTWPWEAP